MTTPAGKRQPPIRSITSAPPSTFRGRSHRHGGCIGRRTSFSFDAAGRQQTVTDPLNHVSTTVYDSAGEVTATVDALGRITSFVYDDSGRQIATVDPLTNRTTTVFDSFGRYLRHRGLAPASHYGNLYAFGRNSATQDAAAI